MVDIAGMRSFHPLVTEKPGRKPFRDIKMMKEDAAAVEKNAEEIKTHYTKIFRV
jgi:iron(III) transport system substrate-binding protein